MAGRGSRNGHVDDSPNASAHLRLTAASMVHSSFPRCPRTPQAAGVFHCRQWRFDHSLSIGLDKRRSGCSWVRIGRARRSTWCSLPGSEHRWKPRNVLRHLQRGLAALKLPHHRFHDLRHTAASLLLAQGCTLHTVQKILGHSQIALTSDLYGHLFMSVAREAMAGMDAALSPVAPSVAPQATVKSVN